MATDDKDTTNPEDQVMDQGVQDNTAQEAGGQPTTEGGVPEGQEPAVVQESTVEIGKLGPLEAPAEEKPAVPEEVVKDVSIQDKTTPIVAKAPTDGTGPVVTSTAPKAPEGFQALIDDLKLNGTREQKDLIHNIETYMAKMKPNAPIDTNHGAAAQHAFWKVILGITGAESQDVFKRLWSILLAYFNEYQNGALGDRYVYRFSEYWRHGEAELAAYQRILNILLKTRDPASRKDALAHFDMNRSLEQVFSPQARQRIVTFYRQ